MKYLLVLFALSILTLPGVAQTPAPQSPASQALPASQVPHDKTATQSTFSFYGRPARWLFDLIKTPTSTRNSKITDNGVVVGFTQYEVGPIIECTAHGKTIENPKTSDDAQLVLCTIKAETVRAIFPQDQGGSVDFAGPSEKALFDMLPKQDYSRRDNFMKETVTMKSFGRMGIDGISCNQVIPDAAADGSAAPTMYNCSISWLPDPNPSPVHSVSLGTPTENN